ncbi:hypothetical protein [Limnoglobus roseus]|uniref:SbsA Ig-like domain-containing protein n=1 Tax=Limnoglobus roseus TaxID=2598579 RepID=A0A5C1AC05_9BACT|nr:hypothetical protein [Limnoglobus roseus]QEL15713.1 hypothetical protein PX52LOC_02648 [Limnoglobus roseus]
MIFSILLLALAADPTIRVAAGKTVEVTGLPDTVKTQTPEQLAALVRVTVAANDAGTSLLGTHAVKDGTLTFTPRFPFEPGVTYRVSAGTATHEFTLPKPKAEPATVTLIEPTADKLPENTLRFYLHFSKPMAKGDIYKYLTLTNDTDKKTVTVPFLELEQELWSPDQKRVTIVIDPGRIKREVKPLLDLGPVLEKGKTYTLTVAKDWLDANDTPLAAAFHKTFTATAADRDAIDPEKWAVTPPKVGGRDALSVNFGKPLDAALVRRLVWVEDAKGTKLDGTVTLDKTETFWRFTPKAAWAAGEYNLTVATHLEDPCGNRVGEPFEVDLLQPVGRTVETKTVTRPVVVK